MEARKLHVSYGNVCRLCPGQPDRASLRNESQTFAWWSVVESTLSFLGKLYLVIGLQEMKVLVHFRKEALRLLRNTAVNDKGNENPIKARECLINTI